MQEPRNEQSLDVTLAQAARGDGRAWRVLVETYSKRVYALLVHQCGDRELSEEITQATFVKVVGQLGNYEEHGRFEPWLFRIAMNNLRDEMRRRKRQARPMDMSAAGSDGEQESAWAAAEGGLADGTTTMLSGQGGSARSGGDGEEPFERVSRAEQIERLRRAIGQLNPTDQEILTLRHTAGLSFAQIAESLGEPLGTVLARGHRALAKLRKLMGEKEE